MAVISKINRNGVDVALESMQQKLYTRLISYWDVAAVYSCYPRANKNYKDNQIIPEISLDFKDYKEVLFDDKVDVSSFFLVENERDYNTDYRQSTHSVSIIFQADLKALYGQTDRADEKFNMDVLRVLSYESFYINSDSIRIIETPSNVYSDINISDDTFDKLKLNDLSKKHVVRFDFEITYKINCEPLLPATCAPVSIYNNDIFVEFVPSGGEYRYTSGACADATYQNSNGSFIQPISSGSTFTGPDVTITIDGTDNVIPANEDASFSSDPVTVSFQEDPTATNTPAGENLNIDVFDSAFSTVGTLTTDTANLKQIQIADATNTMNGASISGVKAEGAKAFEIVDANGDNVDVTIITNTTSLFRGSVDTGSGFIKGMTGQEDVVQTNDDGWNFLNGSYDGGLLIDHYTLATNNEFGNNKRKVGRTGGYTDGAGNYFDKDGVPTTKLLAFPDDVIRDYFLRIEVYFNRTGNGTWADTLTTITSDTVAGFSDWRMFNNDEVVMFADYGDTMSDFFDPNLFNWAIFSIWTGTKYKKTAGRAYRMVCSTGNLEQRTATENNGGVYVRDF